MKKLKISIIGSGWLGLALANHLLEKTRAVNLSTTNKDKFASLKKAGLNPYLFDLYEPKSLQLPENQPFFDCDVLVLTVPPRPLECYQNLLQRMEGVASKLIVISSTSIYKMTQSEVDESDPDAIDSQSRMFAIEKQFESRAVDTSIVRFGGLIGQGRHPVRWFQNREQIMAANAPVNFIHQADCVRLIESIIRQQKYQQIYNGVAPSHPTKQALYSHWMLQAGVPVPEFIEQHPLSYKTVSSAKAMSELNFEFQYPSLLALDFEQLI